MSDDTAKIDAAAQEEARRFGLPMSKCPGCREVKFVGHGPLCLTCYATPEPEPRAHPDTMIGKR